MEQTENASHGDNVTQNTTGSVLGSVTVETKTQEQVQTPINGTPATTFNELLGNDGKFVDGWTSRLPENLTDYGKTLSKFKSPIELMTSYANLEKEFSKKSNVVKLPSEEASEEDWNAYKKAIGAEYKPEDYGLNRPEDISEEVWNGNVAKQASEIAAKYGIPKKALHEFVDIYNGSITDFVSRGEEMQKQQYENVMGSLKKEWGVNTTNNLQKANRAAIALGLDPNDSSIGNNANIIKALTKVDELLGEDKTKVTGTTNSNNTYDELYKKIMNSDEYKGKFGIEKQMEAQSKLKGIFEAMRS
jgi:hypothetical protein